MGFPRGCVVSECVFKLILSFFEGFMWRTCPQLMFTFDRQSLVLVN